MNIVLSNRSDIVGKTILEDLGIVAGSVAPSRFIVRDITARIRNMLGREMIEYTEMMDKARDIALDRLKEKAESLGAHAVVNVRIAGTSTSNGSSEIMAYGTAVKLV